MLGIKTHCTYQNKSLYLMQYLGLNMEHKMKHFNVSKNIVPIGEFKASLSKWFKNVQNTGHPLIITQYGRPAGVLLSPSEYDELNHKKLFVQSVNRGISDVESGNIYSTEELKEELKRKKVQRDSK